MKDKRFTFFIKRSGDIILSTVIIIVISPILILCSLFIFLEDFSSPFFLQERAGKNGNPFYVIKLRTMKVNAEQEGTGITTSQKDYRITKTGNILRKLSVDELPQLMNVIKGDMSLVGPRPVPISFLEGYSDNDYRRLEVKPGITGWAQINGRNLIPWSKRIELDIWYVDNVSIGLDLKIFFKTIYSVIFQKGVYSK